jgi:hypothetical protein
MYSDDCNTKMNDLFSNPLFKIGFFDFFLKMQQEGIEAARKYWITYEEKNSLFPNTLDTYERMADFYIILGFVPRTRYDQVLSENKSLKDENKFLRDTMRELQINLFTEGGETAQQIWHKSIDKQLEINKEIAKNFFEIFRILKVSSE